MTWLDSFMRLFGFSRPEPAPPMTSHIGQIVSNRVRAVERARRIAALPSRYILGTGGRSPSTSTPFTTKNSQTGSDCVGFTCWCLGHDRFQPTSFPHYGGWINTDSLLMDARGNRTWYDVVARPEPGDVVVFPSVHKDGKRVRIGHIGLVVAVPDDFPDDFSFTRDDRRVWLERVGVIDCAGSVARRARGRAVAGTTAAASWDKPDALFCRLVRAV